VNEFLGMVRSGHGGAFLARSERLKPGEDHQAFTDYDEAKRWIEDVAHGDSFTDFEWAEPALTNPSFKAAFLFGRRLTDEEIDEEIDAEIASRR